MRLEVAGARGGREASWLPVAEAAGMFALIMLHIWVVSPWFRQAWLVLPLLAIASHVRRGETLHWLGFRRTNLWPCLAAVAPLLVGIGTLVIGLGRALGTVRHVAPGRLAVFATYYCVWGLFQQYALNGYFVNRFAAAARGRGVWFVPFAAALCFALVHAPNWFLVGVTLGAGWLCAHLYLRYRNLYPLGLAHGLLGTALLVSVPDSVTRHFYIGPRAIAWERARREHGAAPCSVTGAAGARARGRDHSFAIGCDEDPRPHSVRPHAARRSR